MAAWVRFERRVITKGHERISAATEMSYILIVVVVVTQLYIFIKTQIICLK